MFLIVVGFLARLHAQSVGINDNGNPPFAGAILDVQSNTKGLLFPRMSTAQRNAIVNVTTGLMVYDTTLNQVWYYSGGWKSIEGTAW